MLKYFFATYCISLFFFSCKQQKATQQEAIIALGKKLFYDNILSYNQTKTCASCHDPKFAFTDGYKRSIGSYGDLHQRNSKPLFNLQQQRYFTAADSTIHTLLQQMDKPLAGNHPPELGWYGKETVLVERLKADAVYTSLFNTAFANTKNNITYSNTKQAIAAFVTTITSNNTRWDKYQAGDTTILNAEEKKGMQLFFSTKTNCSQCHGGNNFDQPKLNENYFNIGIYNIDNKGSYPPYDEGLKQLTHRTNDMGKYKVPTLRNLLFTKPYYHDGSETSLDSVLSNYNKGGRNIPVGQYKGNGIHNPFKHFLIKPLYLTDEEKKHLLLFLTTLTDSTLYQNKNYTY